MLIKFRNRGTPKGRTIVGLILIGVGAIMTIVGKIWSHGLIQVNYEIADFIVLNLGYYNISNLHTIIGYLVLISALFCDKNKYGDYTQERETLLQNLSVDEIVASIAERKKQSKHEA
ncbi:MAG: hypothetical protein LBT05_13025 [Planctomycetaceae bacterium]|nr:hypothetical protein [Planctomycetaceae bacterium]